MYLQGIIFNVKKSKKKYSVFFFGLLTGVWANVFPTLRNSGPESPTFESIAKVNPAGVQWKVLALGEFGVNFTKHKFFLFAVNLDFCGWIKRKKKLNSPSITFYFSPFSYKHSWIDIFYIPECHSTKKMSSYWNQS